MVNVIVKIIKHELDLFSWLAVLRFARVYRQIVEIRQEGRAKKPPGPAIADRPDGTRTLSKSGRAEDLESGVGLQAMFADIQPLQFLLRGNP